jgi:hypothetical protein
MTCASVPKKAMIRVPYILLGNTGYGGVDGCDDETCHQGVKV